MPTKAQLKQWIPGTLDDFKSVMPPIDVPYPPVYIVNSRNFAKIFFVSILHTNTNTSRTRLINNPKSRTIFFQPGKIM